MDYIYYEYTDYSYDGAGHYTYDYHSYENSYTTPYYATQKDANVGLGILLIGLCFGVVLV